MRILIADDDTTSRAVLTAVLQKGGHEIIETRDGHEAWAVLQRPDAPRIAIVDWMMPGIDGVELCRRVRATWGGQSPYLVLLTTRSATMDIDEGLRAGADDYLGKPYNPVQLAARIDVGCRFVRVADELAAKTRALQEARDEIDRLRTAGRRA